VIYHQSSCGFCQEHGRLHTLEWQICGLVNYKFHFSPTWKESNPSHLFDIRGFRAEPEMWGRVFGRRVGAWHPPQERSLH
jgi:hypothetical protein